MVFATAEPEIRRCNIAVPLAIQDRLRYLVKGVSHAVVRYCVYITATALIQSCFGPGVLIKNGFAYFQGASKFGPVISAITQAIWRRRIASETPVYNTYL